MFGIKYLGNVLSLKYQRFEKVLWIYLNPVECLFIKSKPLNQIFLGIYKEGIIVFYFSILLSELYNLLYNSNKSG